MSRKLSDPVTPEDLEWLRNNNRGEEARRLEADQAPTLIPSHIQEMMEEGEDDYDDWKPAELREEAMRRELTVPARAVKATLIKLLRDDDLGELSA